VGVVGVCAASREDRPRWFVATRDGRIRGVDLDDGSVFFEVQTRFGFPEELTMQNVIESAATLVASDDGRFLAVVQRRGAVGGLYEVESGRLLCALSREDYHANVSAWPLAMVKHEGRDVLITSTAWNRLEALELPSLVRLAPKSDESKLDYFWGQVSMSADGRRLASFGWFWHPVGALRFVDVGAWLSTGVDPPKELFPSQFAEWWDDSVCWLDDGRVAMRGQPTASADAILDAPEGVAVVDLATQSVQRYFPTSSPSEIAFDGTHLLCLGEHTHCLSLETGEVTAVLERRTDAWHPGARVALTIPRGEETHFELHWLSGALGTGVPLPATTGANELLVLADSLEERGFAQALVSHCRAGHPHGRRCWVLEGLREPADRIAI
jgi:hypothetical protein